MEGSIAALPSPLEDKINHIGIGAELLGASCQQVRRCHLVLSVWQPIPVLDMQALQSLGSSMRSGECSSADQLSASLLFTLATEVSALSTLPHPPSQNTLRYDLVRFRDSGERSGRGASGRCEILRDQMYTDARRCHQEYRDEVLRERRPRVVNGLCCTGFMLPTSFGMLDCGR